MSPPISAKHHYHPQRALSSRHRISGCCQEALASWDPGREGEVQPDRFWDASSARTIDHEGQFFHVRGPLNVPRSPQGHPVIAQAGASEGGSNSPSPWRKSSIATFSHAGPGRPLREGEGQGHRSRRDPSGIRIVPGLSSLSAKPGKRRAAQTRTVQWHRFRDGLLSRFARKTASSLRPST